MSTNDELKNETANGTKPVLSAVLIEQLDKCTHPYKGSLMSAEQYYKENYESND